MLDYLSNEEGRAKLEPIDHLYLMYLMLRKAEDHGITDSRLTLSKRLDCTPETIRNSRKRLVRAGYITVERRKGRSSAVSINIANIPAEARLRSKITTEAKSIAVHYQTRLRRLGRKKFGKYFLDSQLPSAQSILDSCKGDEALATAIIDYAVNSPVSKKFARKSLYELWSRWRKVKSAFDAANAVVPVPIAVIEPTPSDPTTQRKFKWVNGAFKYSDDLDGPDVHGLEVMRCLSEMDLEAYGDVFFRISTKAEVPLAEALRMIEGSEEEKAV